MRTMILFAIMIVFGVLALLTKQMWLFIIPAILIGISLVLPKKETDESTEEIEYQPSEEEMEKMKGYADAYPSNADDELDDSDITLDEDLDIEEEEDEDIFADIDLDFEDDIENDNLPFPSLDVEPAMELEDDVPNFLEQDVEQEQEILEPEEPVQEVVMDDEFNNLLFEDVMSDTGLEEEQIVTPPSPVTDMDMEDPNDIDMFIPANFVKEEDSEKGLEEIKENALKQLNKLIGLDELKNELQRVIKFLEVEKKKELAGKKTKPITLHMTFKGDAGTGKTTVARIIGELLKGIGILESGHFIETDRSGLVASYVGQTAEKTKEIVQQAMGGVLFIDEAYALASGGKDDFGQEAIDTLIKEMEDHRDKFVCILAGYDEDMERLFSKNQGFESRVRYHFQFPNYTIDELMDLTMIMMKSSDMIPTPEAREKIREYLENNAEEDGHVKGNGRTVRNLIDEIHVNQNNRIADSNSDDFDTVLPEDIPTIQAEETDLLEQMLI